MGFQVRAESRTAVLGDSEIVLGRSAYCTLVLENASISRLHAVLRLVGADVELEDLGSRNGTFVNGQRLTAPRLVRPGDRLEVGTLRIQLEAVSRRAVFATGALPLVKLPESLAEELDTTEIGGGERE